MAAKKNITQKNWDIRFRELQAYLLKHKRYPVKKENNQLYTWCAVQRLKHKKKELSAEKVTKLNSIEFVWDVQEYSWQNNLLLLDEFRRKNPERWPSQRSKDPIEHKLAVWFLGIRKDFKNNTLLKERKAKLEEMQFPFYPREDRWSHMYGKLVSFQKKMNRFPRKGSKNQEEMRIFNWCRYQSIKMDFEVLTDEKKKKLVKIGIKEFSKNLQEYEKLL